MKMLPIYEYPAQVLLREAAVIDLDELRKPEVNALMRELVDDMFTTMYAAPGVGLAAPQVGVSRQLLVMDCRERGTGAHVMLNPMIRKFEGDQELVEGCLSFPGIFEKVKRFDMVEVQSYDLDGQPQRHIFTGFESVCFQHELEHLAGVVFIRRLSPLKQALIKKKMAKRARRR